MKQKLNCILLIDDDEPTNFLSRMLIEDAACTHHIQVAQSGEFALSFLKDQDSHVNSGQVNYVPDLIFLDINMPAMNGWEFLDKYSELKPSWMDKVITIMLTTSYNPDDRKKAEEHSVISRFETKPLTSEKLDKILKDFFPGFFA